jgi:IclR family transcriptional regulator, acetate operon repressor
MNDTSVSVTRSFRVFDALAKAKQPLSSADIARLIEAPRSSTADLLRTLVGLNLLSIDRRSATYFPTARFSSLGSWLESSWFGQAGLRDALRELAAAAGETTVLCIPTDLDVETVAVFEGPAGIAWSPVVGERFPIFGSAMGTSYLSTLPPSTIRAMHRRAVSEKRTTVPELSVVLSDVRANQRASLAWNLGTLNPEVATVACHLPQDSLQRPLFVAIGGPCKRIQEKRALLEASLKTFVAMRLPSNPRERELR